MRIAALISALLWGLLVLGQGGSLTEDFEKLSAKERTRIAQMEAEEAANDQRYQAVMAEAEDLFRQQRFDESLERYTVARGMRPYNVYPKVKIQDLQVLIAKRDSEQAEREAMQQVAEPVGPAPPVAIAPAPVEQRLPVEERPAPAPAPLEVPEVKDVPAPARTMEKRPAPAVVDAAPEYPEGVTERMIREGRAIVLERVVVSGGRTTIWRKVDHPWGETVYFKDGAAVPGRAWDEVFGDP